jgi:hypothetical protein
MDQLQVLLIEDNEGDIFLFKEALESWNMVNPVQIIRNGQDAMRYFNDLEVNLLSQKPDLIFLDINLPFVNGLDLLKHIKLQQQFKNIPIVMLTSCDLEFEINETFKHYACHYIVKPLNGNDFSNDIAQVLSKWKQIAELPNINPMNLVYHA